MHSQLKVPWSPSVAGESQLVVHNYRTVFQNSSTFSLQRSLTSAECCAFLCCFRDQVGVYHWCFIFSSVVITTIHHLRALVIHLSRQRAEPLPSSFCSSILTNTTSGVRPTFFHSAYCAAADDVADVDDRSALLTLPPALYGPGRLCPSLCVGCPEFFSQLSSQTCWDPTIFKFDDFRWRFSHPSRTGNETPTSVN